MNYLCVDGGQTKTAVFILEKDGRQLASWEEEPLIAPSSPKGLPLLRSVIDRICEKLGLFMRSHATGLPLAMCFSLTGYLEGDPRMPELVNEEVQRHFPQMEQIFTLPDYVGNWMAATMGKPGIVIISGGGTVAYGRDGSGAALRVGGWGHLLGDEGSGYWIGLQALKATLQAQAGLIPHTELVEPIMERLEIASESDLLHRVYSHQLSDAAIASLVPIVCSLAQDQAAARILDDAAIHLVQLAVAMERRLGKLPVYLSGGVFRASAIVERFQRLLTTTEYATEVHVAPPDPLRGILFVAQNGLG